MDVRVAVEEVLCLERNGRAAWVDALERVGSRCPVAVGGGRAAIGMRCTLAVLPLMRAVWGGIGVGRTGICDR